MIKLSMLNWKDNVRVAILSDNVGRSLLVIDNEDNFKHFVDGVWTLDTIHSFDNFDYSHLYLMTIQTEEPIPQEETDYINAVEASLLILQRGQGNVSTQDNVNRSNGSGVSDDSQSIGRHERSTVASEHTGATDIRERKAV